MKCFHNETLFKLTSGRSLNFAARWICLQEVNEKEQNGQPSQSGSVDDKELSIQDTTPQTTQVSAESNEPDNRLQTLTLPETASVPQQVLEMTSESNGRP